MLSRRQFLRNSSALAVAAVMAPAAAFAVPIKTRDSGIAQIAFSDFASSVNTVFWTATKAGQTVGLLLVTAKLSPASGAAVAPDARKEKFSLLFAGPLRSPISPNTQRFEHDELGKFEMFIGPVGRAEADLCYYEAVFNRPVADDPARLARTFVSRATVSAKPKMNSSKTV
jgi:hypothetical protein